MNAHTRLFFYRILFANQLICSVNQYEYGREYGVCSTQNFLPDQNFQFYIFNFTLKRKLKSSNTNTCPDCFPKGRG